MSNFSGVAGCCTHYGIIFCRLMRYSTIAGQDILVGGFNPSEKYEFVSWEDDIPDIWKNMFQTTIQY